MNLRVRDAAVVALTAAMLAMQWIFRSEKALVLLPLVVVAAILWMYRKEIRAYDWSALRRPAYWADVLQALTHGIIGQAVGIVILTYGFGASEPDANLVATPLIIVSGIVLSGIIEEVVYRKIMFNGAERYLGYWPAAVFSSILFAFSHYNTAAFLGYVIQGVIWCRIYRRTGNLGVLIAAHMLFNLVYFAVALLRG
ncbi:CPBP family intramembrane metalloprotease [Paenibacillus sp. TRM 82003]|nr:CPBP family intramembrane metalloprotease [Paenibacillus sp. TRM 82003]